MSEYIDYLNMEYSHLNNRQELTQNSIIQLIGEYKTSNSKYKSNDKPNIKNNKIPEFKNKDLEAKINNNNDYSIYSINLPNISTDVNLNIDQSSISMIQNESDKHSNRFRDAGEIRMNINRLKQGIQSADPSKKVELRTAIGFRCNKFESLKGSKNKMNKSI